MIKLLVSRTFAVLVLYLCTHSFGLASGLPSWLEVLKERPYYLQLQAGVASDTDFVPSLVFGFDRSVERTHYQGVSLGTQLNDSIFGWPAEVVGYIGLQNFEERSFQSNPLGVTAYWKIHKQWAPSWFNQNLPIRFGLGQGLSYVSSIPVSEARDFAPDKSALTVHYLEWTVQMPVGGLLSLVGVDGGALLDSSWIGYSIFHRSTVFGLFGETGGGVNYPGVALEFVFH